MVSRVAVRTLLLAVVLLLLAPAGLLGGLLPTEALAQEESVLQQEATAQDAVVRGEGTTAGGGAEATVYDDTGALSAPEARKVQKALDRVRDEEGEPLYVFVVNEPNVTNAARRERYLVLKARQAQVPEEAGVLVLDPVNEWAQVDIGKLSGDPQGVSDAVLDTLADDGAAPALVAGAEEIVGHDLSDVAPDPAGDDATSSSPLLMVLSIGSIVAGTALLLGSSASFERRRRRAAKGEGPPPEP